MTLSEDCFESYREVKATTLGLSLFNWGKQISQDQYPLVTQGLGKMNQLGNKLPLSRGQCCHWCCIYTMRDSALWTDAPCGTVWTIICQKARNHEPPLSWFVTGINLQWQPKPIWKDPWAGTRQSKWSEKEVNSVL